MIIRHRKQHHSLRPDHNRRGATLVEAAISLVIVCTIIIGALDFSIASFRSQVLNHIAHRIGRAAAVHGSLAKPAWDGGPWGPGTFVTTLDGADDIATVGQTMSAGLRPSDVTIELTWPNGSNKAGEPVVVETRMDWAPMFMQRFGLDVITLRGRSYQIIQH